MANIVSDNSLVLEDYNPDAIMRKIAERMKQNRLELNLSQRFLAAQSGVSLGSLKRFEHSGEISLKNLVLLAIAMDTTEEFGLLFSRQKYQSIAELLVKNKNRTAKRGRRNVF